ncbi:MAG: MBL fold metallo-hydrolase [Clostridia bacterium]|nr:MBL fold metallo-hydrolase [Clostridia bacterium]
MLRYCSLFSGSSGNCTYVGTAEGGVLIDAGVSAKRIETALRERDIDPKSIRAVLVTHEHSDHIAGLRVLCKRYGWPVLASEGTLDALTSGDKVAAESRLYLLQDDHTVSVAGLGITPFAVPHDSRHCLGFCIEGDGRRLGMATDIGYLTDSIIGRLTGCQLVHIESNHDPEMLRCGPYPYSLQCRIRGEGGHLSNAECAATLPALVQAGAVRLTLAHLSEQNNTPQLALDTATAALSKAGIAVGRDCLLGVASPRAERPVTYF